MIEIQYKNILKGLFRTITVLVLVLLLKKIITQGFYKSTNLFTYDHWSNFIDTVHCSIFWCNIKKSF